MRRSRLSLSASESGSGSRGLLEDADETEAEGTGLPGMMNIGITPRLGRRMSRSSFRSSSTVSGSGSSVDSRSRSRSKDRSGTRAGTGVAVGWPENQEKGTDEEYEKRRRARAEKAVKVVGEICESEERFGDGLKVVLQVSLFSTLPEETNQITRKACMNTDIDVPVLCYDIVVYAASRGCGRYGIAGHQ